MLKLNIQQPQIGEMLDLEIPGLCTVIDLKYKLRQLIGGNVDQMKLEVDKEEIFNDELVDEYFADDSEALELFLIHTSPLPYKPKPEDIYRKSPRDGSDYDFFSPKKKQIIKTADGKKKEALIVQIEDRQGEVRDVVVEIVPFEASKPFLGGYRDKRTGLEYHNAETQMEVKEKKNTVKKEAVSRCMQTNPLESKEAQTRSDCSTQTKKTGYHEIVSSDTYVQASHYRTADEEEQHYISYVRFIQRVCRGWLARRKVLQMKDDYSKQKEREEEEQKFKAQEIMDRKKEEAERCENPRDKADFDMLYNRLEAWRKDQLEEQTNSKQSETTKNRERAKLVNDEAALLMKINKNKNIAKMNAKEGMIQKFLEQASRPILRVMTNGELIEIETPNTRLAARFMELHDRLREEVILEEERVELLFELECVVSENDCKLTRDIISLARREVDFLNRGMTGNFLEGLRLRILNLYLQYIRTPAFNPECKRFNRIQAPDLGNTKPIKKARDFKNDIEYCQACNKFLAKAAFNISAGSGSMSQCRACKQLDNDARTRLDLSLYKHLLDSIKKEEEARNNRNSPAFILQESDIRYLVENIWNSRSIISGNNDLFDLRLARWECAKQWTPWNCILLSREENKIHTQLGGLYSAYPTKDDLEKAYGPLLMEAIISKHTVARNHFAKMSSMTKFLDQEESSSGPEQAIRLEGVSFK